MIVAIICPTFIPDKRMAIPAKITPKATTAPFSVELMFSHQTLAPMFITTPLHITVH